MVDETSLSTWLTESPICSHDYTKLLVDVSTNRTRITLENLLKNSEKFPIKFPLNTVRNKNLLNTVDESILQRNINASYPLIHENVLNLYAEFLIYKCNHGTDIEKKLYSNITLLGLIRRILTKKAAAFVDPAYNFILPDGTESSGHWETVGTKDEKSPLILENCLSYDEIKLSSFLSLSSYSYFINNGARGNRGITDELRNEVQEEGVVVSLVGPKFTMRDWYDHQEIVISKDKKQNINFFFEFYREKMIEYEEGLKIKKKNRKRFTEIRPNVIFDNLIYEKRLAVSFDTFLLEANYRAKENNTYAYVHLVGIGLGVWSISIHQQKVFVDALAKRISFLGNKLNNISDLHLSYFPNKKSFGKYKDNKILKIAGHPKKGIKIHISNREPFSKLSEEHRGKLLVVSYAADGNSLPGNEFWKGFLGNSSDSATTASSQISELHNPHINKTICAENLMIATCSGSLITVREYFR